MLTLMNPEVTDRQRRLLGMFAAGQPVEAIAAELGTDAQLVARTIERLAGNDRGRAEQLVAAYDDREAFTGDLQRLLARAADSDRARTRALGEKVRQLVDDLVSRLVAEAAERREEEARAAAERVAEQRVAELRKLLGEAEDGLKAVRRSPATTPRRASSAADVDAGERVDPREVRAWAAANGVPCNALGRVPGEVVAAWRAATGRAA